ncbi:hypothetical protein ACFY00_25445 [Kitasatospora sp. NPDC001540]|uniref:hypothetical protein n=1 Tax=Kitasatospora sp. NPDC001540 TaxID=3364014 RepID=UPI0036854408
MEWFEQAQEAERAADWDTAVALVSARSECYSTDHWAHGNHLWHMALLAEAGRFAELARLAQVDVHARRSLNRALRDRGMAPELHARAADGDRGALYALVRLLGETGRLRQARRAVREFAPEDRYAHRLLADFRPSSTEVTAVDDGAVQQED